MTVHTFRAELEFSRVPERLRDDDRSRDAPFFKLYRVVHTAQRAGASSANGSDRDLNFLRHPVDDFFSRRFGIVFLATDNDSRDTVVLA